LVDGGNEVVFRTADASEWSDDSETPMLREELTQGLGKKAGNVFSRVPSVYPRSGG